MYSSKINQFILQLPADRPMNLCKKILSYYLKQKNKIPWIKPEALSNLDYSKEKEYLRKVERQYESLLHADRS